MPDIKEMTEDEIRERKKLLAYQLFHLEVQQATKNLENSLKANEPDKAKE